MGIFQIGIILFFTARMILALRYHGEKIKIHAGYKFVKTAIETAFLYFGGFFN